MRLQKFLARAGVASRRKCEQLIAEGRVSVNGRIVCEMGAKVSPGDSVEFDGQVVELPDDTVVIMLNKPAGYLTAMSDSRECDVVAKLVPTSDYPGLFPVGRLDRDTTGLLLFTTDGELGNRLLHPSNHVEKRYVAEVQGELTEADVQALEGGIELDDGMTSPAKCEVLELLPGGMSRVALTIHEGRKRQVRRMFAALGHDVVRLHRESFGPLSLGDLPEGQWRLLSTEEMRVISSEAEK